MVGSDAELVADTPATAPPVVEEPSPLLGDECGRGTDAAGACGAGTAATDAAHGSVEGDSASDSDLEDAAESLASTDRPEDVASQVENDATMRVALSLAAAEVMRKLRVVGGSGPSVDTSFKLRRRRMIHLAAARTRAAQSATEDAPPTFERDRPLCRRTPTPVTATSIGNATDKSTAVHVSTISAPSKRGGGSFTSTAATLEASFNAREVRTTNAAVGRLPTWFEENTSRRIGRTVAGLEATISRTWRGGASGEQRASSPAVLRRRNNRR
jgi:hypothetical protein